MLQQYDGTNPDKPVYLGLNGFVYDITPGRADFYDPGQPYHFIAGRDSSQELNMVGGEIIRRKYKIVGRLVK
jgi:predicted heme/steroid binding protein